MAVRSQRASPMSEMGRPLKFSSVAQMQTLIDAYFLSCHDEEGKRVKPYSVTGLALALDCTRETLDEYQKRADFSDSVKKAKLRVENYYEENLPFQNATGSIFALKNFGWHDKQQTEHSGGVVITKLTRTVIDPKA